MMVKTALKRVGRLVGPIVDVATADPLVALTFDDGPDPVYTPQVLRLLERHGARATFFMVGEAASRHPDLVRAVSAGRHVIGNHSWSHFAMPTLGRAERRRQLESCAAALRPYESRYFRPPYGAQDLWSFVDVSRMRYDVVGWNLDVADWCNADSKHMATALAERLRPGSIVLLHDTIFDQGQSRGGPPLNCPALVEREPMIDALRLLFEEVRGAFQFVTIPELLAHGSPRRQAWDRMTP
jgi:peptidoglycan-N-acetylglucosamine deacetylase